MKKCLVLLLILALSLTAMLTPALAEATPEATETAPEATETVENAEEADAEEEEESWSEEAFGDLTGLHWYTYAILAILLIAGIYVCAKKAGKWTTRRLAYAAMCIAIAFVLSCIKLFRMPQGGSVTPASMLPLILFALACGPAQGMVVGCAYGLLQLIEDAYVIHPIQLLVDYPMAFAALSLACLANRLPIKSDRARLPIAMLLGYLGRYIMATISGAVFFAEYAGEQNAWIYSLGYNLQYLGIEAVVAAAISCIPGFDRILSTLRKRV